MSVCPWWAATLLTDDGFKKPLKKPFIVFFPALGKSAIAANESKSERSCCGTMGTQANVACLRGLIILS